MRKTDALLYAGSAAAAMITVYFVAAEGWTSALPFGILTIIGLALAFLFKPSS